MSLYNFSPSYAYGTGCDPYVFWTQGFTNEELDNIIEIGESKQLEIAKTGTPVANPDAPDKSLRQTEVSWIKSEDAPWLYDKLAYIVNHLNSQYYDYDITGFYEDFQYGVYTENSHYGWHIDSGNSVDSDNVDKRPPRKLSISLQLSDPEDYEGGELQIQNCDNPVNIKKERGFLCMFPSYTLHRVTPVTKGIRKSLVVWVTGPRFR